MPKRGAAIRAEQLATVGRIAHQKFTAPEIGKLIDGLRDWGEQHDYDSFEASLVRVAARDWEKASKVPSDLRAEMSRSAALANPVWVEARETNDFGAFLPVLRRNLDLRKRYIDCFEGGRRAVRHRARRLRARDEDEGSAADLRLPEGAPGAAREGGHRHRTRAARPPTKAFDIAAQKVFELEVAHEFGFDDEAWRLDPTVHPFASGAGIQDIRITTRYFPDRLEGLFGTMHEFGHGLYEHRWTRRSSARRSRAASRSACTSRRAACGRTSSAASLPFWRRFFPRLQELLPEQLRGYDVDAWYREVNAVEPSLIRVEADEATYNLHIILRFELEQAMIAGRLPARQLPGGMEPPHLGVPRDRSADRHRGRAAGRPLVGRLDRLLPDVRARQPDLRADLERITADLPDLDSAIEEGDFAPLRDWLREHLHRHGRKYTPAETLERVSGTSKIDPEPYVRYLRTKLAGIYQ